MSLADLIPDGDYRFHMRFERSDLSGFFGPTADRERLLAERQQWLLSDPERHAGLLPPGELLLDDAIGLFRSLNQLSSIAGPHTHWTAEPLKRCLELGTRLEPDFLLLKADDASRIRLWGGCVCFPSSWSLAEKIGHPVEHIHGVVPGLNEQLGSHIQAFLSRLKPGAAWRRSNWGMSRSPELNQHPARRLPHLDESIAMQDVWLRIEDQALVALPRTGGILFGIRLKIYPLETVASDPIARGRLIRALSTMPEPVARYKGLSVARVTILELLDV
jgi:hypothetical protein